MKTTPMIFNGDMVRALLEGRKTQTRRPVKGLALEWLDKDGFTPVFVAHPENHLCQFGYPGDLLWVRETWGTCASFDETAPRDLPHWAATKYAADGLIVGATAGNGLCLNYRPSIHMPRRASRLTLRLTGVRIERVMGISQRDASEEGVDELPEYHEGEALQAAGSHMPAEIYAFGCVWESLYKNWGDNPWVWVLEFELIRQNIDEVQQ